MGKDIVIGLGEIGRPILKSLSKSYTTVGYDIDTKLMHMHQVNKTKNEKTVLAHICIPYSKQFEKTVTEIYKKYQPEAIIIHSTIAVGTTDKIQKKLKIPVIYSATRGVHKRMMYDLKRYTKFFALSNSAPRKQWVKKLYIRRLLNAGITAKEMSSPKTLELAKIVCDTSYYGWLINYAQLSNTIAIQHGVNYDEMWTFTDEIQKYLGNRPKMFPGYIGGHCVIPNLDLIHNQTLDLIKKLNETYAKKMKKAKWYGVV